MTLLHDLVGKKLIHPPPWLPDSVQFLATVGSESYGISSNTSDQDIMGWCIPSRQTLFPHLAGFIPDFGTQPPKFAQWDQHHIKDAEARGGEGIEYDFNVYSVVKFFQLCLEGNPTLLGALFVPQRCVLISTHISELVRENRKLFLHKGCFHKYRGYCFSQLSRLESKTGLGKNEELVSRFGFNTKMGTHAVRLLLEAEQILESGDLDLERDREVLKSIRKGEWELQYLKNWCTEKEKQLEETYNKSELPWGPDEDKIKALLIQCLTMKFGDLSKVIIQEDTHIQALRNIRDELNKVKL